MNRAHILSVTEDGLIAEVSQIVATISGIQLGAKQIPMVKNRIRKRIVELELSSVEEYVRYLHENREQESVALVSLLTTHHTFFFREFVHFEFLERQALPLLVQSLRKRGQKTLRVWSAGCSRGQEVYSLSMFLSFHLRALAPEMDYQILGTDIDPESVAISRNGVYRWDEVKEVPALYLSQSWVRGTEEIADFVKARPKIKAACEFEVTSLLDSNGECYKRSFDLIFCRNVFIYFATDQIKGIVEKMMGTLNPEGYLIIGLSEGLDGLNLPLHREGPSIYARNRTSVPEVPILRPRNSSKARANAKKKPSRPATIVVPEVTESRPLIQVMCVEDSLTVTALLKKILTPENGFEVVATATDGVDAAEKLKNQPVDIMTLDIHMPGMSGDEYMRKNFGGGHPPVVIISSVQREEAGLALECLRFGATDYVEKPAMQNFSDRGDEIRTKLRCALQLVRRPANLTHKLDYSFKSTLTIHQPQNKLRLVLANASDKDRLLWLFDQWNSPQPPTVILIQGSDGIMSVFAEKLYSNRWKDVQVLENGSQQVHVNRIYLGDLQKCFDSLCSTHANKQIVTCVMSEMTDLTTRKLVANAGGKILLAEATGPYSENYSKISKIAEDITPYTSLAYLSDKLFG